MSTAPEVNPYAPMGATEEGEEIRKPPRWLALLVSFLTKPLAGAGLLVLGRTRPALIWMGLGLLAYLLYVLPVVHALSGVAAVLIVALWVAGIVVTATARPGTFLGWWPTVLISGSLTVAAIGGGLAIRVFVTEAFQIPSGAMIPTLFIGDHILVDKASPRVPARGDVIVFRYPQDPSTDYIKRVVGLPGEQVSFKDGQVLVDGKPLPQRKLDDACPPDGDGSCAIFEESAGGRSYRIMKLREGGDTEPFQVPPDAVFVAGDNRDNSNDSRVWGALPLAMIKGRARTVWFSKEPEGEVRWDRCGIPIR